MARSTEQPPEDWEEGITRVVGPSQVGRRLDVFLAAQPELDSRSAAKDLVRGGRVRVDGRSAKVGQGVQLGQEITFWLPVATETDSEIPAPPEIPVLHVDPHLVLIDKPAGIPVHPPQTKGFSGHTVASLMQSRFGRLPVLAGDDRPGIVHRLDKDTSGVMVLARTDESFHFLRAQFKARTVQKEYRALVYGEPRFDSEHIERPIGPNLRNPSRMSVREEGGRTASTYYEVVERFEGFAYLRCVPKTGRTHQIRVHMMSVGHSLIGDRIYRSRKAQNRELAAEAPDPGRHCLHAHRLGVRHPRTHEEVEFEAPLAADMARLLAWLRASRASE